MRILNWRSSPSLDGEGGAASTSLVQNVQSCVSLGGNESNEVHVAVSVQLDAPPEEVWTVLRSPDSPRIFRNIKAVHSCDILEDDNMGNRKLKVVHTALAKLMMMTVSFETRMWVWESQRQKSMRYTVCEPTFLKKYEGRWALTPLPPALPKSPPLTASGQQPQALAHLGNWSQHYWSQLSGSGNRTLLVLEQTMVPSMPLPGLVQRCLGDICNREINNCVADLDAELQRRKGATTGQTHPAARAIAAVKDATSMAATSLQNLVAPLVITSS